jgi:hypothetical protein
LSSFTLCFTAAPFTVNSVSSVAVAKKQRFGPKVGTQGWWIQEARSKPPIDKTQWINLSKYQLGCRQVLAEYDYLVLGEECEGDLENLPYYPPRIQHQPHYFAAVGFLNWREFKVYTWTKATQALGLPVSAETKTWCAYLDHQDTRVEAVKFLGRFKLECKQPLDPILEVESTSGPPEAAFISSVVLDIPKELPKGDWQEGINTTIKDNRQIPTIDGAFHPIRTAFIKFYLEQRLLEYLALGGIKELVERKPLVDKGYHLPDPFFWDLWGDLDNLRKEYSEWCEEEGINPEADQDQESAVDTVTSFDTQ